MSTTRYAVAAAAAVFCAAASAATDADVRRCRALTDNAARLACYDSLPVAPADAAPGAAAPAAPAAAAAPAPAAQFGFEAKAVQQGPDAIESRIVGLFEGWGPHSQFKLENGQVWQVTDDSRSLAVPAQNPKVRISRASFGTFFLEIEGKRAAPRVKRVE
jgi:hypothetical protein